MARQTGPIEAQLRRKTQAYITRHGHGSATKLAKQIDKTSAWVGLFIAGQRRLNIDDAAVVAKALGVDLRSMLEGAVITTTHDAMLDLEPLDKRELILQRIFVQIKNDHMRNMVIAHARSLMQMDKIIRKSSVEDEPDIASDERREA